MYRIQEPLMSGGDPCAVMMFDDNGQHVLTAPFDEANTDYQAYLAWVAEGNEPETVKGDMT